MAELCRIVGLDKVMKMMDAAPANSLKLTRKAMREASKQTATVLRGRVPERWRSMTNFKIDRNRVTGEPCSYIGLFAASGGRKSNNDPNMDWFKAYWNNYGTLQSRDPNHKFKYPIKPHTTKLIPKGQLAHRWFEKSLAGIGEIFMGYFRASFKKNEEILYNR